MCTQDVGIWNMQSLHNAGKLANITLEMKRLKLDIIGVAETWWPNTWMCNVPGVICYSGNQEKNNRKGVGIITVEKLSKCVINFLLHSDWMKLLKLNANPVNINIIQGIYAHIRLNHRQDRGILW